MTRQSSISFVVFASGLFFLLATKPVAAACNDHSCENRWGGSMPYWLITNCNSSDADGDDQLCNNAGRLGGCGGQTFCCPGPGEKWTTDMTVCDRINKGGYFPGNDRWKRHNPVPLPTTTPEPRHEYPRHHKRSLILVVDGETSVKNGTVSYQIDSDNLSGSVTTDGNGYFRTVLSQVVSTGSKTMTLTVTGSDGTVLTIKKPFTVNDSWFPTIGFLTFDEFVRGRVSAQ